VPPRRLGHTALLMKHLLLTLVCVMGFMIPSFVGASELLGWSVNRSGDVLAGSDFVGYDGTWYFGPSLDWTAPNCGVSGTRDPITFANTGLNYNLFSDWNLGVDTDCDSAGNYYLVFTDNVPISGVNYYYQIYYDGVNITPTASDFDSSTVTRFTSLNIHGTSSIEFDVGYYLEQSEIDTSVSGKNPSHVMFGTSLRPSSDSSFIGFEINETAQGAGTTTGLFGTSTDGVYDLVVRFGNLSSLFGGAIPFPNAYMYSSFTISGGVLTATGTTEFYNGFSTSSPESFQYQDCGITAIDGCINNAFVFLFVPNSAYVQENYLLYRTALETNAPFSYIYDVNALWSNFASTTGSTTKPEVPFTLMEGVEMDLMASSTNSVPDSVRIGLRAVAQAFLWGLLAFAMWHDKSKIFS